MSGSSTTWTSWPTPQPLPQPERPTITASPAAVAHGTAFSVQTPSPAAIAEVVLMSPGAVTHGFNQNQRYVGCAITGTTADHGRCDGAAERDHRPARPLFLFLVLLAFPERRSCIGILPRWTVTGPLDPRLEVVGDQADYMSGLDGKSTAQDTQSLWDALLLGCP
jgi:hypothetical protein